MVYKKKIGNKIGLNKAQGYNKLREEDGRGKEWKGEERKGEERVRE